MSTAQATRGSERVEVRTERIEIDDLIRAATGRDALAWIQGGDGLVGLGEFARIEIGSGPDRFQGAADELERIMGSFDVEDDVRSFGTGPVAFGSFTFDPERSGSVLRVPKVVLGRRAGQGWVTTVGDAARPPLQALKSNEEPEHDFKIRYAGSSISEIAWLGVVGEARDAVRRGELEKVVLARDLKIWSKTPFDVGELLLRLSARFPECFTFSCEGLVGATPELLIRRRGRDVESLVLAGSARRGDSDQEDASIGRELLASHKDLTEHEPAVRSVVERLRPLCDPVRASDAPQLLRLNNVQHLATPITGHLRTGLTSLEIAGRLQPTAAVGGLPRDEALGFIREKEDLDRGRYAGPVGWVDREGDGEWGIALRCAELGDTTGRLFAGVGVVAESVPEEELEETRLKLRAMMSALGSD
jgi:menaquinone-specific isochorismate synthase